MIDIAEPPSSATRPPVVDPAVLDFFTRLPEQPHMQQLSSLYQRHPMSDRPALEQLRMDIESLKDAEKLPADFLAFMTYFTDLEIGALGKPENDNKQKAKVRGDLENLRNYLSTLDVETPMPEKPDGLPARAWDKTVKGYEWVQDFLHDVDMESPLPHRHRLPEHQQHLLKAVEHHTGQGKAGPVKAVKGLANMTLQIAEHIFAEMKQHPKKAAGLALGYVGLLLFMKERIGASPTMYVDPKLLQVNNLSIEAFDDANFVPQFSDVALNNVTLPWHDHMAMLVGNNAANWARDYIPGIEYIAPKHAAKLLDFASGAQDTMNWCYVNFFSRMMSIIGAPAEDLGNKALPESAFKTAFMDATSSAERGIVAYNMTENIVFHSLVLFVSYGIAKKIGSMKNDEFNEHWNKIKNFTHQTVRTSPGTYIAAVAGAAAAYIAGDGFNPAMIWSAVMAGATAEALHKNLRRRNREAHTGGLSEVFNAVSEGRLEAHDFDGGTRKTGLQKLKGFLSNKFTLAAIGVTAAAVGCDVSFNQAVGTAKTLGYGFVIAPYILYDLVEDNVAHVIFALVGGAAGLAHGKAGRKIGDIIKAFRQKPTVEQGPSEPSLQ